MSSKTLVAAQLLLGLYRGDDILGFAPDLALFLDDPRIGGLEVTGGAYARRPIVFGAPSGFTMVNSNTVTFAVATTDWGIVKFAAVMNGDTVWDVQAIEDTDENREVLAGSAAVTFAPGEILMRIT